ncbi:hypothetical protein ACFE04_028892 [Oxalis oulophora]
MIAAICYAWLLENRERKSNGENNTNRNIVVPVMNMRRQKMWKQLQAAWLFHHVGLDTTSLFFADEVDLESLMMSGQLNMVEIGQDVLKTNSETGSRCTILADNYCEDAYDLLQTPILKKLLLAGILLETQNVSVSAKSTARDAEAVQLLLVGSAPNYRNALFDQLMQDQKDSLVLEALQQSYGKPPNENGRGGNKALVEKASERKSTSAPQREAVTRNSNDTRSIKNNKVSPKQAKPNTQSAQEPSTNRGKNTFFLAKWFGFGK